MSEQKLKKVFNLPKNLYISGSPIIISYGGLFKDESGDRVFVSLGLKDVKAKEISSFKVSIQGYATSGNLWARLWNSLLTIRTEKI